MQMPRKTVYVLAICAICVTPPATNNAQARQVEAALLALTGTEILSRADQMLNDRIFQAEQAASGLVNQALTGMSVLAEAARLNLGDVAAKTLKEMNEQQRSVFLNIQSYIDNLNALAERAYTMAEVANIDVANRLGAIPFVRDAVFISSIKGLALRAWEDSHAISVVGSGLGPGESGVKADVSFRLNGRPLIPTNSDLSQHNQGRYTFSKSALGIQDSLTSPRTVVIAVHLGVERSKYFGVSRSRKDVDTKIRVTVFPRTAGILDISYDVPVFQYKLLERRSQPFRTSDCGNSACGGGGRNQDVSTTAVANGDVSSPPEGNRVVANPAITCGPDWWDPAGCRYVYDLRATVNANKTAVDAHWRVTGVWVTMHVSYDVLEWSRVQPRVESQTAKLEYGRVMDICLPKNVDNAKIRGRLLTKQEFEVTIGAAVPQVLQYQGRSTCPTDGGTRHSYLVMPPT